MAVADGSQVRLAYVAEATIGTTPSSPVFQTIRYETADIKADKQTEITNEVRADRNVGSIVKVGQSVAGPINGLLSYGTWDVFFSQLLCSSWSTNVLKNGVAHAAMTIEQFYELGSTDAYIRFRGCRINTLDMMMETKKAVNVNWGVMGMDAQAPATAILSGATYTAATTTEVMNAALNVTALTFTGITNGPKIQKLSLRINNNIYANDIIGQEATYSHGLGRHEISGSFTALFENAETYKAILDHDDIAIATTIEDTAGNSYEIELPKVKLLNGAPTPVGNSRAVIIDVPFQAYYDSGISATIQITRTPA